MIQSIKIANYKSIHRADVQLNNLNILIGQNGAGKSNFISFFKFLERLSEQQLATYIFQSGGINNFLHKGFEESQEIRFKLTLKSNESILTNIFETQIISDGENYTINLEKFGVRDESNVNQPIYYYELNNQQKESDLKTFANQNLKQHENRFAKYTYIHLKELKLYHFHDTSDNAAIKLPQPKDDVYFFKNEGQNLAPYLSFIKNADYNSYLKIVETIRLVFPSFHDFVLEENPYAKGKIVLRWKEKSSENIYSVKQMSDGTLRFICLAILLTDTLANNNQPETIILDEPELGLHPFAIHILAELIQKAALNRQIIIATQSVNLINHFTPKDLLIVERNEKDQTIFKRVEEENFNNWLEDYTLGQLWENNFFGGRP
ncbi:MAG: AAA family ATPase [Saprospiraceae bacterium]